MVVDAADEALLNGEAGDGREERLRHAVRHVNAVRLAPLGDDVAVAHDHAVQRAPLLQRPDDRVERFPRAERRRLIERQVLEPWILVGDGVLDGRVDLRGIHAGLIRCTALPLGDGRKVRSGLRTDLVFPAEAGRHDGQRENREQDAAHETSPMRRVQKDPAYEVTEQPSLDVDSRANGQQQIRGAAPKSRFGAHAASSGVIKPAGAERREDAESPPSTRSRARCRRRCRTSRRAARS